MKKHFLCAALLVLVCCIPQEMRAGDVSFDPSVRYSRIVIDNCLYHFKANTTKAGFAKYDGSGSQLAESESSRGFDYVPGLVAKAVLECVDLYKDSTWAAPWFYSIQAYGETYYNTTHGGGSLDDLNACKLYFGLYDLTKPGAKFENATVAGHCATAKGKALTGLSNHNSTYAISSATSNTFCGNSSTYEGGWWHKSDYNNQLWLDGQYMGPALLAMMVADGRYISGTAAGDWAIIRKQFDMCWNRLWDSEKKLLYHAFSANPTSGQTTNWADHTGDYSTNPHYGVSSEFWGRAAGWYFFALVDILEQMDKIGKNGADADYVEFKRQLEAVADGLLARQDATTGCWCQLLQYGNGVTPGGCSKANYLESSASAIFVSTFLKGIRLGYLDRAKYEAAAKKGYQGLINQFLKTSVGDGNDYALINCCKSAGLSSDRNGTANYYLSGSDTGKTSTYTEGKVLGAFILAATEYERAYPPAAAPEPEPAGGECRCLRVTITE